MVNVIDHRLGVDQFDQVFDDLNDVFLGEYTGVDINVEIQFLVDTVTTHIAQVIPLLREEEVVDHLACTRVVGRLGTAQLSVDMPDGIDLRVAGVFLQGVVDDGVV